MKVISGAVQADADICNTVDPPTKGCHAGSGLHVVIPSDFAARILAGQSVSGCSYCDVKSDGTLCVTDRAQAQLLIPAVVAALPVPLQTEVAPLNTKLAAGVIIAGASLEKS